MNLELLPLPLRKQLKTDNHTGQLVASKAAFAQTKMLSQVPTTLILPNIF